MSLRHEKALLETVLDLEETLAVLIEHCFLDRLSIDIYRYIASSSSILLPAVEAALQNSSHLLTNQSSLIIRRIVPVGCSIHGGLPLISLGPSFEM